MKTNLSPKYFLMVAAISLIVASCKKETVTYSTTGGSDPSAVPGPIASIVDLGPTDSIPHIMQATIEHQYVVLTNGNSETSANDAVISFSFNSVADGIIPAGTYIFTDSVSSLPFTFTSGMVKSVNISGSYNEIDTPITGGRIEVIQKGDGYYLSFDCALSTGDQLSGVYTGPAQYTDNGVAAASTKK
jgi:hypothetical protein